MQKTSSERSGPPERVRSTSPRESHQVRAWNSQLNQYSTSFVFLADARFVSDCRPIGVIVSERTALAVSKCETSDENERYSLTCRRERDFCCRRQARKKCPREKTYAQRQRTAITKREKWPRKSAYRRAGFQQQVSEDELVLCAHLPDQRALFHRDSWAPFRTPARSENQSGLWGEQVTVSEQ
jgi:hypothetical protein